MRPKTVHIFLDLAPCEKSLDTPALYTHDCMPSHSSTSIIKFADDTVVLGLINNNDEATYLDEVKRLTIMVPGQLSLSEREQN